MKTERRYFDAKMEIRTDGEEEKPKIVGYAAVFDRMSENLGGFREIIKPGAFKNALNDDVRALWNHDPNYVLGRNKSGTLTLAEDERGLKIEVDPPNWASDFMETMKRGDVDQMSFGFMVNENGDKWYEENGQTIRELHSVSLFDVSPVTYPAYPQTSVSARSIFNDAGIDFEALSSVITRSNRGLQITDSDRDLIKSSIEVLNNLAGDSQGATSAEQERQGPSIAMELKKLKLLEVE